MRNANFDADGMPRCWNCGAAAFNVKRTFRSKAALGVGAVLTKKKLRWMNCGAYSDTGGHNPVARITARGSGGGASSSPSYPVEANQYSYDAPADRSIAPRPAEPPPREYTASELAALHQKALDLIAKRDAAATSRSWWQRVTAPPESHHIEPIHFKTCPNGHQYHPSRSRCLVCEESSSD
jgi:hypothetical protein